MAERWRNLGCFEGYDNYEISDHGRLRSLMCSVGRGGLVPRSTPRLCAPRRQANGYMRFRLQKNGRIRSVAIHELVLHAFVGPRPNGCQAAHGNGDPSDNRLSNLRWATPGENMQDQIRHGTIAARSKNGNAKLRDAQVHAAWFLREHGCSGEQIARLFGVAGSTIHNIFAGRTWASLGPPHDLPEVGGILLDLLGPAAHLVRFTPDNGWQWFDIDDADWHDAPNLGTACFRAALARGRWG